MHALPSCTAPCAAEWIPDKYINEGIFHLSPTFLIFCIQPSVIKLLVFQNKNKKLPPRFVLFILNATPESTNNDLATQTMRVES